MSPLGVVLLLVFLAVLPLLVGRVLWRKKRSKIAETWPTTVATVQSGEKVIASTRAGDVTVFSFAFSYVVDGEYYSGRFELLPNADSAHEVLRRMTDRKFQVRYDPSKPQAYHISDAQMEGCDVNC